MTSLFYLALATALIVFQTTLASRSAFTDGIFDLLLPLIVRLGLFPVFLKGFLVVLLLGYAKDALSGGPFGMHIVAYTLIFFGVHWSTRYVRVESPATQTVLLGAAAMVQNLIFLGLIVLSDAGHHGIGSIVNRMFTQTLSAFLLGHFILWAIRSCDERWIPLISDSRSGKNKKGGIRNGTLQSDN